MLLCCGRRQSVPGAADDIGASAGWCGAVCSSFCGVGVLAGAYWECRLCRRVRHGVVCGRGKQQ